MSVDGLRRTEHTVTYRCSTFCMLFRRLCLDKRIVATARKAYKVVKLVMYGCIGGNTIPRQGVIMFANGPIHSDTPFSRLIPDRKRCRPRDRRRPRGRIAQTRLSPATTSP